MEQTLLEREKELLERKQAGRSLQELLDTYAQEHTQCRKESYIGEPESEIPTEREFIESGKQAAQDFYNEVTEYFEAIETQEIRENYHEATAVGMTKECFLQMLKQQVWNNFEDDASTGVVGEEVDISFYSGFNDTDLEIVMQVFEKRMGEIISELVKN